MFKYLKNIFVLIFICFAIWMLFFDANSLIIHSELNSEISDLEDQKVYYGNEIIKDKKAIKQLSTDEGIEKMAREKYYMKKENEDIYIIEYEDSLKLETQDD
ncbi:septum formation initiator [Subsaximicrobium wynnwilliamsii]|uniref:Septum formation initiator n=2 Tax=Subsaximicrobium wynnwilliamsii TaxID=291179 RepID=A0A5C6ZNB0_9FLAO|nr:septum formation initiator [Subsaximicrobium wynnwilliamsii]TXD91329.1 septum formation initiator [Subsaximicrobium wynnwilliamsii]TXE04722.1 septum formation initiator [Subsaximicrobium wynnwilliamsii]